MDKYQALFAFYESRQHTAFEWGNSDCALLAADWVKLHLNVDYAAPFRGRYRTELGSKRALKKLGYTSLADAITASLGEPLQNAKLAQRGDVVLVTTSLGDSVGIVDGFGVMVQGDKGIVHVNHSDILYAWRVR